MRRFFSELIELGPRAIAWEFWVIFLVILELITGHNFLPAAEYEPRKDTCDVPQAQ